LKIEWIDPKLWLLAIILGLIVLYFVGPLTGNVYPHDLFYQRGGTTISVSGWSELLIFVVVIRAILGAEAAREFLEKIF